MSIEKSQQVLLLAKWFMDTDRILDEADLDKFHDKSILVDQAEKFLNELHINDETEKEIVDRINF